MTTLLDVARASDSEEHTADIVETLTQQNDIMRGFTWRGRVESFFTLWRNRIERLGATWRVLTGRTREAEWWEDEIEMSREDDF